MSVHVHACVVCVPLVVGDPALPHGMGVSVSFLGHYHTVESPSVCGVCVCVCVCVLQCRPPKNECNPMANPNGCATKPDPCQMLQTHGLPPDNIRQAGDMGNIQVTKGQVRKCANTSTRWHLWNINAVPGENYSTRRTS